MKNTSYTNKQLSPSLSQKDYLIEIQEAIFQELLEEPYSPFRNLVSDTEAGVIKANDEHLEFLVFFYYDTEACYFELSLPINEDKELSLCNCVYFGIQKLLEKFNVERLDEHWKYKVTRKSEAVLPSNIKLESLDF